MTGNNVLKTDNIHEMKKEALYQHKWSTTLQLDP
jgi:hypothetical protein